MTLAGPLAVDGHVHIHRSFRLDAFFENAWVNLRGGAREAGAEEAVGALMFTEGADEDVFAELHGPAAHAAGAKGTASTEAWRFERTNEPDSLIARRGGHRILLIAGRQIATREGLEVLALGARRHFPAGLGLRQAIDEVLGAGAVPVVPWGFGKWWLKRGELVAQTLRSAVAGRIFVGDNAGRLAAAPRPRLFADAAAHGVLVLPGSDPLPFASQVAKVGRYGFILDGAIDETRPADGIRGLLRDLRTQPRTFGRLENVAGFVRSQVGMQIVKRMARAAR